uniref:Integrase core domain containing protein n=1 Tax=Solanum tuberosum TaxID=4113 RepID=M1DCN0_SOLTU
MDITKGKQVVTSDTQFDRRSAPPPPLKRHGGVTINESSEAPRQQPTTPPSSTCGTMKAKEQVKDITRYACTHSQQNGMIGQSAKEMKDGVSSLIQIVTSHSLCRRARVPLVEKTNVELTPTSSTDIWRIEAERRRVALVDISLVDDVEILKTNTTPPTQAGEPSAQSAVVRASRLEHVVTGMIERANASGLPQIWDELRDHLELIITYGFSLDAFTV